MKHVVTMETETRVSAPPNDSGVICEISLNVSLYTINNNTDKTELMTPLVQQNDMKTLQK